MEYRRVCVNFNDLFEAILPDSEAYSTSAKHLLTKFIEASFDFEMVVNELKLGQFPNIKIFNPNLSCHTCDNPVRVEVLIGFDEKHSGAGSFIADGLISDTEIEQLIRLFQSLEEALPEKASCSYRRYYSDGSMIVRTLLTRILNGVNDIINTDPIIRRQKGVYYHGNGDNDHSESLEVNYSAVSLCHEALPNMKFLEVSFCDTSRFILSQ
jgi:hypothetical protein